MQPERWRRLREIYDQVCDVPPVDRDAALVAACGGDADLLREARALLDAAAQPHTFLDTPRARLIPPALTAGDVLLDRFDLRRPCGEGGMGEVWAAYDRDVGELVAVKIIGFLYADDPAGWERFRSEVRLARSISHPNVCRVYELFQDRSEDPPRLFLTMELIEGDTLAARLAREGPLAPAVALPLFRDIAAGLAAVHARGIVHRDLKPSNVMLVGAGPSPRPLVMDFGLARAHDVDRGGLVASGATSGIAGTRLYMAPEQTIGGRVTTAADVYALGLLLYEMLAGHERFLQWTRDTPRLASTVAGLPPRIDAVIARCVEPDPARRFASVADVVRGLDASPWRRWRPARRTPWAAAAVVAGVIGAGLAARGWPTAPDVQPDTLRWYGDAQQALAEGAAVRALNDITRAINLTPSYAPAHAALAEILLELDMPVRAQEAMLAAERLAPDRDHLTAAEQDYIAGVQALLLRNCADALRQFAARSGRRSPTDPYELLTTARAQERCDAPAAAEQVLRTAGQLDARNAAVPLRRARLLARRADYAGALAELDRAEALFRDRNNLEGVGEVLGTRGTLLAEQDRLDDAAAALRKAGEIAQSLDDVRQQVRVRLADAVVLRKRGAVAEADVLTREAIELARRQGLETLTLDGLFTAANVHLVRNQFAEARALFEQALGVADTHRDDAARARARLSLATVFVRVMEESRAREAIEAARPYYERIGHARNLRIADTLLGQVQMMRGEYAAPIAQYTATLAAARDAGDREQAALALDNLASAHAGAGDYAAARAAYDEALLLHRASGRARNAAFTLLNLAELASKLGEVAPAREALAAAARAGAPLPPEIDAQRHRVAAAAALREGRYAQALRDAERSEALNAGASSERMWRARLVRGLALAGLGRMAPARALCADALAQVPAARHRGLRLAALLAAAEVAWAAGDRQAAGAAAAEAEQLLPVGPHEERWRVLAWRAAAAGDAGAEGARAAVAREVERFRLSWGERQYDGWRRRNDVRRVLMAAGLPPER